MALPGPAAAGKLPAAVREPAASLVVSPSHVALRSKRATQQLVVSGQIRSAQRDLTGLARFRSLSPAVVQVSSSGQVRAVGNGRGTVEVHVDGVVRKVTTDVSGADRPDPVRFSFETIAVLTKQGCATGSCHGSPHGRGGFSLSLFGYDPQIDRISLTRDGLNRRVDLLNVDESLLLKKPTLRLPHGGGKRLRPGELTYRLVREWIAEGCDTSIARTTCDRLEVTPGAARELRAPYLRQQLSVVAHFSDGTSRDVTEISTYDSSHPDIAAVSANGVITARGRGQAAISVRYLDRLEALPITVVTEVPGFVWKPEPETHLVDRLVNARLRQLQFLPSELCSDEVFLRRIWLDLTGLLPPVDTARSFPLDRTRNKREVVVDRLLASEEHARYWAQRRADLLRVTAARLRPEGAESYSAWLIRSERENVPYDSMVRDLLTAGGELSSSPAGHYFAAISTQEERTEMTAQLFMGSRLECARCHNHPFENWTMRDYYRLAAVFARTAVRDREVVTLAYGEVRHPTTGEVLRPWAAAASDPPASDLRVRFAEWLTARRNPFFARVEVNRIWAALFGRGIVEPVDDFRVSNPSANPELLDALARELEQSAFNRRHVIRLICTSRAYQRSTSANRFNEADTRFFSHQRARLLGAEQLQDAVALAAGSLAPPEQLSRQVAAATEQVEARRRELNVGFAAWREARAATVRASPIRFGAFRMLRVPEGEPVPEADVPALSTLPAPKGRLGEFVPPEGSKYGRWSVVPTGRDEQPFVLPADPGRPVLLLRSVYADADAEVHVRIRPGGVQAWLNGRALSAIGAGQDRSFPLGLTKGENRLVLRLSPGMMDPQLLFASTTVRNAGMSIASSAPGEEPRLPAHLAERLLFPSSRAPIDDPELREAYWTADPVYTRLSELARSLQTRESYATQRGIPKPTDFTAAFGQPRRETACTCERQAEPTLIQALELLNGQTVLDAARTGARNRMALPDPQLVEQLYLAALSRQPTVGERRAAARFLREGGNREERVADLTWSLLNTQEFLLQH
jgi:hypothetical protein